MAKEEAQTDTNGRKQDTEDVAKLPHMEKDEYKDKHSNDSRNQGSTEGENQLEKINQLGDFITDINKTSYKKFSGEQCMVQKPDGEWRKFIVLLILL